MELPGYLNRFDFDGGSTGRNKSNWSGSDGKFQFRFMVFLIRNSKTSFSDISAWFEMTDIINNIKMDIWKKFLNFRFGNFIFLDFDWKHHEILSNNVFSDDISASDSLKKYKNKMQGRVLDGNSVASSENIHR